MVVKELQHTPVGILAEKYSIPRSTIFSWECQLRMMNKKASTNRRGSHPRSGSGRGLSYPQKVDEEIMEWILVRRDLHLPVGTELIKVKARQLIKPYNSEFKASSGWLHKFMMRHGLSLRSRTSISQKLPAQLERKLESFLNHVRLFRKQQEYPLDLIIIMDKTPMYFNMVPERTVTSKGSKEVRIRSSGAEKKKLTVALTWTGDIGVST